ncbi:MAG TPA: DUF1800 domain-containing protein [Bryobacteraceae bacterium]|nr:DUF1800 domain-containing protein [Bryobacteraceae bacterium]
MRLLSISRRALSTGAVLALALVPALAGTKKIKPIKASANPPQYTAFSKLLPPDERLQHALERLTFGPRAGDLDNLQRLGLRRWLDLELHPEKVPENPALAPRLAELASLPMTPREIYLHYPPPQMIAAVARGRAALPDDPELRQVVLRLADRYLQKRAEADGQTAANAAADSDLEPRIKLADILTPAQIETLRAGKPEDKKQILASLPVERRTDFVWALRPEQRRQLFTLAPVALRRELMLAVNPQNVVASDLTEAKLLRAIYSNHQLEELLVDFWYNHFNIFLNKGGDRYLAPPYEREAIRPRVFGKFYDLLLSTAESPAMLFYLDNWQSVAPGANQKNKRGLNENYGRELLELHTLGVDGGYTQNDVIAVARCFTGWTIANPRKGGGFEYNDKVHDKGQKIVLGHVIPAGGGMNDGLQVLQILAQHPSTAHFISLQLARRFVADDPPPSLVNRMAQAFGKSGGDLRQVMETMLASPEFWSQGAYRAKIKTPFELVVSTARATNADVESAFVLGNELQKLGEPLYRKVEPTGYSSSNAEWISTAALLERMNFAVALAHNRIPGVTVATADWQTIGSPEFQRK